MNSPPQPNTSTGVPLCSAECPHYLRKRGMEYCLLQSFHASEIQVCLPAVRLMAERERKVRELCQGFVATAPRSDYEDGEHIVAKQVLAILNDKGE